MTGQLANRVCRLYAKLLTLNLASIMSAIIIAKGSMR